MHRILEMLKNGDSRIVDYSERADEVWTGLLSDLATVSISVLSKRLSSAQRQFEQICEDRFLGKVVMAWSGFAHLYSCDAGFEENGNLAYKLSQAFEKSMCSIEVKGTVRQAAESYSVRDYA